MTHNDRVFNFINEGKFKAEYLNSWLCTFIKEFGILNIPESKTTYSVETFRNSVVVEN